MDDDERHEDFTDRTAAEDEHTESRARLWRELMDPDNDGVGVDEQLRRTARGAVEDWMDVR